MVLVAWNKLAVNDLDVEIILACTAIESIALLCGIISSATGARACYHQGVDDFDIDFLYRSKNAA
ncbi:MAG: hypothetical protein OIN83_10175 [Candidatus Methanoperedens sp.]|nr:hypothetical protein [Candidatus Methanoperedens sp.]